MTDSSISDVPAFADALSPLERAAAGLQDELSVFEIALLTFPDQAADQKRLTDFLLETIKAGRLVAYGNPEGWYARVSRPNQQPLSMRIRNRDSIMNLRPIALGEQWERCNPHEGTRTIRGIWKGYHAIFDDTDFHGDNCLIQRANYLTLLATPAALGIPKPDGWKAPQSEPAPTAPTLAQGAANRAVHSDREILEMRKSGLSVDAIHSQGIPRDRIKRVNKKNKIPKLPPGPKPRKHV